MPHSFPLKSDPFAQFLEWFKKAKKAREPFPEAFALATVGKNGQPAARMLLFKGLDDGAFLFFTNYKSRKARDLAANSRAAMVFFWPRLNRQVRIEGRVSKVSRKKSQAYFLSRERGSQMSAWASPQSQVIPSRAFLEKHLAALEKKFRDGKIPCPTFWGGFRLKPARFDFWIGREHRLHDRFAYLRRGKSWKRQRLAP